MWEVVFVAAAEAELNLLPPDERVALLHAVEKLMALGPQLPYPHTSAVRGVAGLRELRPRSGHSPWRALYTRIGDRFVILTIAPEARHDPPGFRAAVQRAQARAAALQEGGTA
ncbi:MAG: type II toxin-antitoxin system RelE/ParE family toxin [Thermomicrobium sp.]|nr:type II toxin-antitoxin system RelE/ParE family toxin [Thermomicrobium sp.]MDW8006641.1 type II toxin-antitoxin system RelE/ParE family toxin [Thermomicrobium sp.]